MRAKERRKQICDIILNSLESGDAKLFETGEGRPGGHKLEKKDYQGLFTNVILKYHTNKKLDFQLDDQVLIRTFINLFKGSEEVMIIGDNTRLLVDTDKYRQVILEGRKKWFLPA